MYCDHADWMNSRLVDGVEHPIMTWMFIILTKYWPSPAVASNFLALVGLAMDLREGGGWVLKFFRPA